MQQRRTCQQASERTYGRVVLIPLTDDRSKITSEQSKHDHHGAAGYLEESVTGIVVIDARKLACGNRMTVLPIIRLVGEEFTAGGWPEYFNPPLSRKNVGVAGPEDPLLVGQQLEQLQRPPGVPGLAGPGGDVAAAPAAAVGARPVHTDCRGLDSVAISRDRDARWGRTHRVINSTALVAELERRVLNLEDDLRARLRSMSEIDAGWRAEHRRALESQRTASAWVEWRDDRITQAAVASAAAAWVLTTVVIPFCEDNALVEPVWIAGPPERRQEALDAQPDFFRRHPDDTDREWLLEAIAYPRGPSATSALLNEHSALWLVTPLGNAVTALISFWRHRDECGELIFDFTDSDLSTRFLGNLYQDLSEYAKKTYALLQTPEFVEEFILDQTLEPTLAQRPLEGFRLIDPACGSGHFLLGAFERLLARWDRRAPNVELQQQVQCALDAIYGVDINPFAVAIARFRLTVRALTACRLTLLEQAPTFTYHLAAGDSLLFASMQPTLPMKDADYDEQSEVFLARRRSRPVCISATEFRRVEYGGMCQYAC
jgi:hypothetical protein